MSKDYERDIEILQDQINAMAKVLNDTSAHVFDLIQEVDGLRKQNNKYKKLFDYLIEQKEKRNEIKTADMAD